MSLDLQIGLFSDMFMRIQRGNFRGTVSNAKPICCLSLIDWAQIGSSNRIFFTDSQIRDLYYSYIDRYQPNNKTNFINPFYHLDSEPFYELVWREKVNPPSHSHTPTGKFLRENLEYAKLDDDLWVLLQDADNREYLRNVLINRYLNNNPETSPHGN